MMNYKIIFLVSLMALLSSCLQTRSELGSQYQSQVYKKKNSENQSAQQVAPQEEKTPQVDERDEVLRQLNGRMESLENQVQSLSKENTDTKLLLQQESQKVLILQDALAQMQNHMPPQQTTPAASAVSAKSSDEKLVKNSSKPTETKTTKKTAFDTAEDQFNKKEFKKAILSYQQYVDEFPKGKFVSESKYKIGASFQELGMKDEALAFFEEVIAQYPKSDAGKKAKIRQATLQKTKK